GRSKAKYEQVYADSEVRVLENTAAFPRAFLVGRAVTSPTLGSALGQMVHQPFDPRSEVMLAADTDAAAAASVANNDPASSEPPGSVQIQSYSANEVRMHVSASRNALLVLSDTYYPGWSASVDGQPQPVFRGNVLFRVVAIPAGEHEVDMRFEPASVKIGLVVSAAAVLLTLAALVLAGRIRKPGRTTE
ncbi:MAG: YfhO family protein, partial [Chloroflexi bacterium]|nr:YfhO family protein [Chloroflexota bacterium]